MMINEWTNVPINNHRINKNITRSCLKQVFKVDFKCVSRTYIHVLSLYWRIQNLYLALSSYLNEVKLL